MYNRGWGWSLMLGLIAAVTYMVSTTLFAILPPLGKLMMLSSLGLYVIWTYVLTDEQRAGFLKIMRGDDG